MVREIVIIPENAVDMKLFSEVAGVHKGEGINKGKLREGIKLLFLTGRYSNIDVEGVETESGVRVEFRFEMKKRIGNISIIGNRGIAGRHLYRLLNISEGNEFDLREVERQEGYIREFYRKNGYFGCSVAIHVSDINKDRVGIEYAILEGNRSRIKEISLSGNENLPDNELLKGMKLKTGQFYDEDIVSQGIKRLLSSYKKKWFEATRADFKASLIQGEDMVALKIFIDEGVKKGKPETRIGELQFKGNSKIGSDILFKQMLNIKYFTEKGLLEDIGAIEYYYRKRGFVSASVSEKEVLYSEDGLKVSIKLTIDEGPRCMVSDVVIEGNGQFTSDEIVKELDVLAGSVFDPWKLEDGIIKLNKLYAGNGYLYSKIHRKEEFSPDSDSVSIRIVIDEGKQVRIRHIIIRGTDLTKDEVIRRELLLHPGDLYDPALVFKSQQNIYRLGFVSSVKIFPVNEDTLDDEKDVVVSLKEKKGGAVEFGVGYGSEEGTRGFVELSHRNIYGTGTTARLRGDVSESETTYLASVIRPWIFGYPISGRLSLIDQVTTRESYSLKKYAAVAGIDKDFSDYLKGSIQYEYEVSQIKDIDPGAVIAEEDRGKTVIGTLSPILIRDSRDDRFNPKKGSVNSIKIDYSAGVSTGSELKYVRYLIQSSWYKTVFEKLIAAGSIRGGWADTFNDTEEVPISKRFFLGGRTTVRGFELDSIGPKGADGSMIGGDAYINLNGELRFPLYGKVGGVTFVDAGNVWLRKYDDVDVTRLRSAAGFGIRYMTPVGPLSFDAGWKLDRKKDESSWEWHFTIGNVF